MSQSSPSPVSGQPCLSSPSPASATSSPAPSSTGDSRLRLRPTSILPLIAVILGIVLLLYPVISTNYNNVKQRMFAQKYAATIGDFSSEEKQAELQRAHEYNSSISGIPILDPYLLKVAADPGSIEYKRYSEQLDLMNVMARVRVPAVDIDLSVYHGTSEDVLTKGVGHLYGTALPVGGEGTHAVITTHTGMAEATLFDRLVDVKKDDLIFIDVLGETLAYRVDQIRVVLPEKISDLQPVAGHDYLTLFTCTPYAVNSHRLLVRAERVLEWNEDVTAAEQDAVSLLTFRSWMLWSFAGIAGGLLVLVLMIRRNKTLVNQPD